MPVKEGEYKYGCCSRCSSMYNSSGRSLSLSLGFLRAIHSTCIVGMVQSGGGGEEYTYVGGLSYSTSYSFYIHSIVG